jgi:hypothetical protein
MSFVWQKHSRSKTLLETHNEARNAAAAAAGVNPQERVPWDRERDLEVRQFDPRRRGDMLKSATAFNSRFAPARH